jgi:hypothetical protein
MALHLALASGVAFVAGAPDLFVLHRATAQMIEIMTPLAKCRIRSRR